MTTTKKAPRPLRCHRCGATGDEIAVSESQQMRASGGRKRLHADVRCTKCAHSWWSVTKEAIKRSKAADAEAYTAYNPGSVTVPTDSEGDEG